MMLLLLHKCILMSSFSLISLLSLSPSLPPAFVSDSQNEGGERADCERDGAVNIAELKVVLSIV